ncbi:hypothetical protein, partial [Salinibacter altiplanensis]|uniref:hypothetical protein n=1 Tax=Salinibacter altiplanensis TaxID=1803181 RepID=UPI001F172898
PAFSFWFGSVPSSIFQPSAPQLDRYSAPQNISFSSAVEHNPMCEEILSRFTEEFDPSYFRYKNRKRFREGEYVEIAKDMLPMLERQVYWFKTTAAVCLFIAVLFAFWIETEPAWSFQFLLQFTHVLLLMGGGAIAPLWSIKKVERRRLLCELVVEHGEEGALEDKEKAAA